MPRQKFAKPSTKRSKIRKQLQDMILRGAWQPGSRLPQEQLASQFSAAQGVVREVLLELRATGLVEASDRRGSIVSRLDRDKVLEALELREMHEALAVRRCCERMTRAQLRELAEVPQRLYRAAMDGNADLAASLDREFHSHLLDHADSSMLSRLADNYLLLCQTAPVARQPSALREEHLAILRAVELGRPDDAEQLMRQHIACERDWAAKHLA
jgi:DNA-binding GntR family transcriptional regulator